MISLRGDYGFVLHLWEDFVYCANITKWFLFFNFNFQFLIFQFFKCFFYTFYSKLFRRLFSRNKQLTINESSASNISSGAVCKYFMERKPLKDESVVSTTGLILENRPKYFWFVASFCVSISLAKKPVARKYGISRSNIK